MINSAMEQQSCITRHASLRSLVPLGAAPPQSASLSHLLRITSLSRSSVAVKKEPPSTSMHTSAPSTQHKK